MAATAPNRSGSAMSTRQLVYAATHGRKVTFQFGPDDDEQGYIVGMDDYHWMLAVPTWDTEHPVEVVLVHKGSAGRIKISQADDLSTERPLVQQAVDRIGGRFIAEHQSPSNN